MSADQSDSQVDTAAYQTETYNDDDDSFETGSDFFSDESSSTDESEDECSVAAENNESDDADISSVVRRDTAHVRRWRMVVLFMIVFTGAALTTGTYLVLKNEEFDDAVKRYSQFAESAKDQLAQTFGTMENNLRGLADELSGSATILGQEFPYTTSTLFELKASRVRKLTGIEFFGYSPLIAANQKPEWLQYAQNNMNWYQTSIEAVGEFSEDSQLKASEYDPDNRLQPFIWEFNESLDGAKLADGPGPFAPLWQTSPPPFSLSFLNFDMLSLTYVARMTPLMRETGEILFSEVSTGLKAMIGIGINKADHEQFHEQFVPNPKRDYFYHPHSGLIVPVYDKPSSESGSRLVGILAGMLPWDLFVADLFPADVQGVYVVLKNTCGQSYTYMVRGLSPEFLGDGDLHDPAYDFTEVVAPLMTYPNLSEEQLHGTCVFRFHMYSSPEFHSLTQSELPMTFTILVSCIFILTMMIFCMYDCFVRRRNEKVVSAAAQSNAIISSLFPTNVRDRLFEEAKENRKTKKAKKGNVPNSALSSMIKSGKLNDNADDTDDDDYMYKGKPIADLFPETTILFADIAGFTAWSSVREPSQVFILLETLYRAFDQIARQRYVESLDKTSTRSPYNAHHVKGGSSKVRRKSGYNFNELMMKCTPSVETVGDCYVAVAGLPDPRKDHAVAMCRFARECLLKTRILVRKLEVTLGPDTGDLAMRMGIHSGPVTAGVLRGERSRFQLFGDTMNTAARMEHTGIRDRIQISQATTDLLLAAGKSSWVVPREELVHAKGKGELKTYFLELSREGGQLDMSSHRGNSNNEDEDDDDDEAFDGKTLRLIEWNVDVLTRLLKQIVSHRRACPPSQEEARAPPNETVFSAEVNTVSALDEVKEIVELPKFKETRAEEDPDSVVLSEEVLDQLYDYVCNIAALYRDNPFHNFEHASHVSMSVVKLLSRIVAPHEYIASTKHVESSLHDHTYGITSDPLTQFACVFSALIHDADHAGVSNAQLVKEKASVAFRYNQKSVLEQNSVDLAWNMLMESDYSQLRSVMYQTDAELKRFRQLVVNSVMATDIVDKELKTLRNLRWDRAFSSATRSFNDDDTINRKATIVIEHLIQASDVAHTMQHWHIYRKWNERFFDECYAAYRDGRAETDPSVGWYQGEIGFFDFYIIPLARKLKECGVFGVSSDEYLNYAVNNRQEWQVRGKEIVDEMIEKVKNGNDNKG